MKKSTIIKLTIGTLVVAVLGTGAGLIYHYRDDIKAAINHEKQEDNKPDKPVDPKPPVALTHTVKLVIDGEEFTFNVIDGENLTLTAEVVEKLNKNGYSFDGWTLDNETYKDIYSLQITEDMTLTAQFTKLHTVRFVYTNENNEEVLITTQEVKNGECLASSPEAPTKTGYAFDGWYIGENKVDFTSLVVTENITITAKFTKLHTVRFVYTNENNEEVLITTQEVKDRSPATPIEPPTREGYTFKGWDLHVGSAVVIQADISGMFIGADSTFVAQYEPSITYVTNYDDYVFEDGVITKYTGSDPYIELPSSYPSGALMLNVTSIGSEAFYSCSSLISVKIPSSVTSIGYEAFYSCSSLISVKIPSSVTSIGGSAFQNCKNITVIEISNNVISLGSDVFSGCTGLTSITIPEGVASIPSYAFYNCSGLTSIEIPSGVTSIGHNAFDGCISLTSITIPSSVINIDYQVFNRCSNLAKVILNCDTVPTLGSSAFPITTAIYVKDELFETYQTQWTTIASQLHRMSELEEA